ncbi:MAG TPA: FixH family protein [Polyangiaceae bacterium]|nr:FixH family protein [Polyangiaceae bacterium]
MMRRIWPWVPLLILGGWFGTEAIVLSHLLDDPSFAVEDDYYQKALHWDAQRSRAEQSRTLGWRATVSLEPAAAAQPPQLVVRLTDGHGVPLSSAELHVIAFHNARAAAAQTLIARESSPGIYRAELARPRPGRWEVRLRADRGTDSYETSLRLEIPSAEPKT